MVTDATAPGAGGGRAENHAANGDGAGAGGQAAEGGTKSASNGVEQPYQGKVSAPNRMGHLANPVLEPGLGESEQGGDLLMIREVPGGGARASPRDGNFGQFPVDSRVEAEGGECYLVSLTIEGK